MKGNLRPWCTACATAVPHAWAISNAGGKNFCVVHKNRWQSSAAQTAKSLYAYGMSQERIAAALSVAKATVTKWLARTVKENKARRDRAIFDLWLSCHTQEEIAERVGCGRKTVDDQIAKIGETVLENQTAKAAASHATDFDPPIYNVWKQQTLRDCASTRSGPIG